MGSELQSESSFDPDHWIVEFGGVTLWRSTRAVGETF